MSDTDPRRYPSLDKALRDYHMPLENDDHIRRFCAQLGIREFYNVDSYSYIKAIRPVGDPGPALHIHYSYTTGFASEAEAQEAAGVYKHWKSYRGKTMWGVDHPLPWSPEAAPIDERRRGAGESRKTCPTCHTVLPASGRCDWCS
ncbi:hypothetical protein [Ornithinimicrobium cryptoxanthini]|uniref:hypothetical protein n=1 Tax=Ornithinimicrobium cryptoxanthini TaxID=2934161 RepID=UPI0021172C7E|nr:hypothetical protein [Ornithinimicrobium cryptoxanthini]